jgi:hypothetical protein
LYIVWSGSYFQADFFILNSISYAKSLGKSVEDMAAFSGNQFKTGWNLEGFINGVFINWNNWTPPGNFAVLEMDDKHVRFKADHLFSQLRNNGPVFNVTYDDYLTFTRIVFEIIADHVGAVYSQTTTPDGVIVNVTKK